MGMTLRLNDSGSSVKELQTALNAAGYDLTVDGQFGEQTLGAVKDYQSKQGLTANGIVGGDMWSKLNGLSEGSADTPNATSDALLELMNKFDSTSSYTPKTADQLREQATGEYKSYYDTLRQNAQQGFDRTDLALQQQKDGLGATYDKLREDSAKQYRQVYSQTDRSMLGRGMQRSSYGAQTLANILVEGAEAQQEISDAQAAAEGDIDAQRVLLAQQLADDLNQFGANEQADILARIRELEGQEYDRTLNATNREDAIALQLYQLLYQEGRDKVSDSQWQQQFDFSKQQYDDSQSKSSGNSYYTPSSGNSGASDSSASPGMSWQDFVAALGGNSASANSNTGGFFDRAFDVVKEAASKINGISENKKQTGGVSTTPKKVLSTSPSKFLTTALYE